MKYLKLFETEVSKIDNDGYFEPISVDKCYDDVYSDHDYSRENEYDGDPDDFEEDPIDKYENWRNFTNNEIDKIERVIGKCEVSKAGYKSDKTCLETKKYVINKMKHNWYYVTTYSGFGTHCFKCDQFDGLLKCLKSIRPK